MPYVEMQLPRRMKLRRLRLLLIITKSSTERLAPKRPTLRSDKALPSVKT